MFLFAASFVRLCLRGGALLLPCRHILGALDEFRQPVMTVLLAGKLFLNGFPIC